MLDNKNEILRKKVIFGIISYEQLVKMSAEELVNPEKQQKLRERKNKFFKLNFCRKQKPYWNTD
jgi:hypothetical protein